MAFFQIILYILIGWFLLSIPAGFTLAYFVLNRSKAEKTEQETIPVKDYPPFRRIN